MTGRGQQRGFTLIELMVVISVIAILAAILIPNFLHARSESQIAAAEGNLRQIATAEEEFSVDNGGSYTATISPTIYLAALPLSPADGASVYTITTYNPIDATKGAYEITDGGTYDQTAMPLTLSDTTGATCQNSKTALLYDQSSGVHCN